LNALCDIWRFALAVTQHQCLPIIPAHMEYLPLHNGIDRVSIWWDDYRAIVAHDGTEPTLRDWVSNARICPNRDGIAQGTADAVLNYDVAVCDILRGLPGRQIVQTGLSQGGQKAPVCAYYLKRLHHVSTDEVVTFGAPPCAVNEATLLPGVSWTRTVAGRDIVEIACSDSKRGGTRVQLDGCPNSDTLPGPLLDHASYTYALLLYCRKIGDREGEHCMQTLLEMGDQTWARLQGL
jgi:hypothetical protein